MHVARRARDERGGETSRRGFGIVRRLPSKRYQASYYGPDLTRHVGPTTFTTKADAKTWLAEERKGVESGTGRPPADRTAEVLSASRAETFSEYAVPWITQRRAKGEPLRLPQEE
jgi:hypothetical protein